MKSLNLKSILSCIFTIVFFSFFFTSCDKATDIQEDKIPVNVRKSITTYNLPERMKGKSESEVFAFVESLSEEALSDLIVDQYLENYTRNFGLEDVDPFEEWNCSDWVLVKKETIGTFWCSSGQAEWVTYHRACINEDNMPVLQAKLEITCI